MELINNVSKTLKDDLSVEIKNGSKLSIAAACFSIYAFQELKNELTNIDELRFIFTSPTFVTEKAKKEKREFYIPRLNRERSLYGTEFEIKLRNELTQKAIAKECAEWIREKVTFKSNVSDKSIQGQMVVDNVGYTPIDGFTTVELGCEKGNSISTTIVKDESLAQTLLRDFNEIWNDSKVLQEVTDEVIDNITAAYNENSPDFIYFVTLYNIFNEFLEDVSEDVLPNEATGFKESKIWNMLYNFQKDAALAIINKLEKYNGCILADSVGKGIFGGEGFIMQRLSGNGTAFVEIDGHAVEYDLSAGQEILISTGYLAAMEETCTMDVVAVKGVKNMLIGGEGIFNTVVKGPGKVILQTMPISKVAELLTPFFADKK